MHFQKAFQIKGIVLINCAVIAMVFFLCSGFSPVSFAEKQTIFTSFLKLPLAFEQNEGQTDAAFSYFARGTHYTLFFTANEIVMVFNDPLSGAAQEHYSLLTMEFLGINKSSQTEGIEILPAKSHYLFGNNMQKWSADKAHYAKIHYKNLYPKIDAVFSGNQQLLKYELDVAIGADPDVIRLAINGGEEIYLDKSGDLFLKSGQHNIVMKKPRLYQIINHIKQEVTGNFKIYDKDQVGFTLIDYDKTKPLQIEQDISFANTLGGANNIVKATAVDGEGNIYVTGESAWASFQTLEHQSLAKVKLRATTNAFVAKLNPSGDTLLYSTYLGGRDGRAAGTSIAIDNSGHAYVTGQTTAADFPTTPRALQIINSGEKSAFITKLNPEGNQLVYSTYLGGEGRDKGNSIAVDNFNQAHIAGQTSSLNFPTTAGAYQTALMGNQNAFISILNNDGSELIYSTYLGGEGDDIAKGIAIGASDNVYVTGQTSSRNFPITRTTLQKNLGGATNAFISQIHTKGKGLIYSSYLGGEGNDKGNSIALDAADNVYLTGQTSSTHFPVTAEAFQKNLQGVVNAFISKLNTKSNTLIYSTYLGGESYDEGNEIIVDALSQVYVIGQTTSANFPVTTEALQLALRGMKNAFISKFNSMGNVLIYSSYFDRNDYDLANIFTLGVNRAADIADKTSELANNSVLALTEPEKNTGHADLRSDDDLLRFLLTVTTVQTNVACYGGSNGSASVTNVSGGVGPYTYFWSPHGGFSATASGLSAGQYVVEVTDSNADSGTSEVTITQPSLIVPIPNQTNVSCNGGNNGSATVNVTGGVPSYTYSWSNGATTSSITNLSTGNYNVTISDQNGCLTAQNFTITQPSALNVSTGQTNVSCYGGSDGTATANATGGAPPYSYSWSNGGTTPIITGSAGTYTVSVTDVNGCMATRTVTISQPEVLTSTISPSSPSINLGDSIVLTGTQAGGTPPYNYLWSTGATTNTINVSPTSTTAYHLNVTDNNSCSTTAYNTVTVVHNSTGTVDALIEPYKKQPPRLSLSRVRLLPAALVGSADFNMSQVDRGSLVLGDAPVQISPNGQPRCTLEPLNGRASLLCWFNVLKNSQLSKTVGCPTSVALTGTVGGRTFSATAVICALA